MISELIRFVKIDMWRIRSSELPAPQAVGLRLLRAVALALRKFDDDKCSFRASALTFYSLMSVVPVLATAFGIAKGFGVEKSLEDVLLEKLQGQEEIVSRIMEFAYSMLENVKGGVIAGAGILLVFWTIISLFGNIEESFNHIWHIQKSRAFVRKVSDYLSAMVICPFLFIMSSAATVIVASELKLVVQRIELLGPLSPVIFFALRFLPLCVMWILFTFVYLFMPNGRIKVTAGVFAGVVAGSLYQIFQWIYLTFQIGVSRYNAVYGSFAALPLFLMWLQLGWMIVLFGAELSFAWQKGHEFEFEPDCASASRRVKKLVALRVMHLLVKNLFEEGPALTAERIRERLDLPSHFLTQILTDLEHGDLITKTCGDGGRSAIYRPSRDTDLYTIRYVLERLDEHGTNHIPVAETPEFKRLSECLNAFSEALKNSPANLRLKDI